MQQIYPDLWQSAAEQPLPDVPELVTRSYLLIRNEGNILFYSTGLAEEYQHIKALGGVRQHCLSHADEAGPALRRVKELFGSELWCHRLEAEAVHRRSGQQPDGSFDGRETHFGALEVIPAPGHTPGSTCFLYTSSHGKRYLFTGDTIGLGRDGTWRAGYLPGISDKSDLIASLRMLAELRPDVVLSSAFGEVHPYREVTPDAWRKAVEQAVAPLLEDGAR